MNHRTKREPTPQQFGISGNNDYVIKSPNVNVFVYGTLKAGYPLHEYLEHPKTRFLGDGVLKGYDMYSNGFYPFIVQSDNRSALVHGEVYKIPPRILITLDAVEGEGSLYRRAKLPIAVEGKGNISAFVYIAMANMTKQMPIESGMFT